MVVMVTSPRRVSDEIVSAPVNGLTTRLGDDTPDYTISVMMHFRFNPLP